MSGRPTYCAAALVRIKDAGAAALTELCSEIPALVLRSVIRRIFPPLKGFRPSSAAAVQHQVKSFVHAVINCESNNDFEHSREELALYSLWKTWARSNIANDMLIGDLFEDLDGHDEESQTDKLERMTSAVSEIARSGTCAREKLATFVEFSPFEDIDGMRGAIKNAPTLADIERQAELRELPERLENDESRLQSLAERINATENELASVLADVSDMRRALKALEHQGSRSRKSVDEFQAALARVWEQNESLKEQSDTHSASSREALERTVVIEAKLDAVTTQQQVSSEQAREYIGRVDSLSERVKVYSSQLDNLATATEGLSEGTAEGFEKTNRTSVHAAHSLRILEKLEADELPAPNKIESRSDLIDSIRNALIGAGLKKSEATPFSEEVLAASLSRQVMFFKGSFAVEAARAFAISVSGESTYFASVPVGMTDSFALRESLAHAAAQGDHMLPSVILEGINASPLEGMREILLDQIAYRIGSKATERPINLIATVGDGPGCFPVDSSYLELGPIFDLEQMSWQRLQHNHAVSPAKITTEDWLALSNVQTDIAFDLEQVLQWSQKLVTRRNARFESNILRTALILAAIRDKDEPSILQSLTFGWFMPLWQASLVEADDIAALIDEGNCDSTVADERLKRALKEYRAGATNI